MDKTEAEVALATEDRWMKECGRLDATDREMIREMSQNGRFRVRIINTREMLEALQQEDPEKFKRFRKKMEHQAGIPLTFEKLVELAKKGDQRMREFTDLLKGMTHGQAVLVRNWRVVEHMTWRRVARAAYVEGWFNRGWGPPSNQLMGMALCEKAAMFFTENYREASWN